MSAYPFVKSGVDLGPRSGPILGFVIHMAENDGGTVRYLAGSPARGVSVHYVVENTGRIVQMLSESHMHSSINPNDLRTTDGPSPYGISVAKDVLGSWWRNPNNATIALEMDGRAAEGPNAKQVRALHELVDDLRSRYPTIGLLGHRDFTSRKACPGALIPWELLGGHGPASGGGDVRFISSSGYGVDAGRLLPVTAGSRWQTFDGVATGVFGNAGTWPCLGLVDAHSGIYAVLINTGDGDLYPDGVVRPTLVQVTTTAVPIPAPDDPQQPVDCTDAVAAEHERTRQQAIDAAEAIP